MSGRPVIIKKVFKQPDARDWFGLDRHDTFYRIAFFGSKTGKELVADIKRHGCILRCDRLDENFAILNSGMEYVFDQYVIDIDPPESIQAKWFTDKLEATLL